MIGCTWKRRKALSAIVTGKRRERPMVEEFWLLVGATRLPAHLRHPAKDFGAVPGHAGGLAPQGRRDHRGQTGGLFPVHSGGGKAVPDTRRSLSAVDAR